MRDRPPHILPVIVLAQVAGTSLWFAANAVLPDLQSRLGLADQAVGHLATAVQLGFICGTLVFAFFAISDRYSPRATFLVCALMGAACNGAACFLESAAWLLSARFATGFFLAGIYPVGMKIASGWYRRDLGLALGFVVGAVVLGTALPYLVRGLGQALAWESVMLTVSGLAVAGGFLMFALVPDGPFLGTAARFDSNALAAVFRSADFRGSAFGYFGHMWELYAFWAFVPVVLSAYGAEAQVPPLNVPLLCFIIIAAGAVGSVAGGYLSLRWGSARVACAQLVASGLCCLASPALFHAGSELFVAFLVLWGVVVAGDSPQFSALNARYAPAGQVGSALTIANCIGFGISILSIQVLNQTTGVLPAQYLFLLLVPGPILGVLALRPLLSSGAGAGESDG